MTPEQIEPGACPDGVVVHIRRAADGVLLRETRLRNIDHLAPAVADDKDATAAEGDVILTFYDGDTGLKMDLPLEFIDAMRTAFNVQSLEDWQRQRRT